MSRDDKNNIVMVRDMILKHKDDVIYSLTTAANICIYKNRWKSGL